MEMRDITKSWLGTDNPCPRAMEHLVDLLGKGDCAEHGGRMICACNPHQCLTAARALGWAGTVHDCS